MREASLLLPIARAAERRLGRLHVWAAMRRRVTFVAGVAAASAALRPFVWTLHHSSPALSAARALGLAAAGAVIAATAVAAFAWRTRPSLLAATRTIDDRLGLAEVVASGVAFERDARDDEMALFAIARARQATEGVDLKRLLTVPPAPRPRGFRLMIGVAVFGVLFGAIDRLVVERAIRPVTDGERSAAAELRAAAANAAAAQGEPKTPPSPEEQQMVEAAKRAAAAAERGDRKGANEALEDMRKAERALAAEQRDGAKALRALRDELEAKPGPQAARRPATAASAAAELARELDGATKPEELAKLAERLERAERAARDAADRAKSEAQKAAFQRAADALRDAAAAAARGDKDAAKRAMDRAERELASMEVAGKEKSANASKLGEKASSLDRSLRAGAERGGSEGKDAKGGAGEGAKGDADKGDERGGRENGSPGEKGAPGGAGGGTEAGDRAPVAPKDRLKLNGDLQARADVKEGEKAVSVIEGMGKGGDPTAYTEIFPAYDTVVEDGLREDNVPAARRPTVRRYFQSIRPGEEGSP